MLVRQRPGSAKGVIFMTLEDETGIANIIVWPKVFETLRAQIIGARFVAVTGRLQNGIGRHPCRRRACARISSSMLGLLSSQGGAGFGARRADEVKRPRRARSAREGQAARRAQAVMPRGRNFIERRCGVVVSPCCPARHGRRRPTIHEGRTREVDDRALRRFPTSRSPSQAWMVGRRRP